MKFIMDVNREQNLRIKTLSLKWGGFATLYPGTFLRTFWNPLNTYFPPGQCQWTLGCHFLKQAIENKEKKNAHDLSARVITIKNTLDSVVQFDSRQQYPPRPANQLTRDLWEHNTGSPASTPPLCWNVLTFSYFPHSVSVEITLHRYQLFTTRQMFLEDSETRLLFFFYLVKWLTGSHLDVACENNVLKLKRRQDRLPSAHILLQPHWPFLHDSLKSHGETQTTMFSMLT